MATSTITNTLLNPAGTPVVGALVRVTLMPGPGFRIVTGTEVARVIETTTNASGVWSLVLEENASISPANTYYVVDEFHPARSGGPTRYIIQVGAADQSVFASMVSPSPDLIDSEFLTLAVADARYQQLGALGGTPTAISPEDAGGNGVSVAAARADHEHSSASQVPNTIEPDDAAAEGVAITFARGDHEHGIVTAAPSSIGLTSANSEGAATSFPRSDHVHGYNPPACKAARTTDQTISNNTNTAIQFNATDIYDTASLHDTTTNNTRITVATAGLYACVLSWTMNTSGTAMIGIFRVNGTTDHNSIREDTTGTLRQVLTDVIKLAANDYVEGVIFQLTGGNVTMLAATMSVVWVGVG